MTLIEEALAILKDYCEEAAKHRCLDADVVRPATMPTTAIVYLHRFAEGDTKHKVASFAVDLTKDISVIDVCSAVAKAAHQLEALPPFGSVATKT